MRKGNRDEEKARAVPLGKEVFPGGRTTGKGTPRKVRDRVSYSPGEERNTNGLEGGED